MHSGRVVPEEAAVPGQHRTGAVGPDLACVRNSDARGVAQCDQVAAVRHVEGEEAVPEATARRLYVHADTGTGSAGQDAGVGSGAEDFGRGRVAVELVAEL